MNPAEGELRPQLSDRIGLQISVQSIMDIEDRVKIMERRKHLKRSHPSGRNFKISRPDIGQHNQSPEVLDKVNVSQETMKVIAQLCVDMGVDGHRADIAILKLLKPLPHITNIRKLNLLMLRRQLPWF